MPPKAAAMPATEPNSFESIDEGADAAKVAGGVEAEIDVDVAAVGGGFGKTGLENEMYLFAVSMTVSDSGGACSLPTPVVFPPPLGAGTLVFLCETTTQCVLYEASRRMSSVTANVGPIEKVVRSTHM
jgi:hypothetical protein